MTFGIDILSVFSLPPIDFVRLAATLGRPTISMALAPFGANPEGYPSWSLRSDAGLRHDLKAALNDSGVRIALGEGFVILPGSEIRETFERDMAMMAELRIPRICVVSFDPDVARTQDLYAEAASLADSMDVECLVEFAPCFPSTPDLGSALNAREHVGLPNFRLLIDTMHLARSGGAASELAKVPPQAIGYVQICDAPRTAPPQEYIMEAMSERMPPGNGDLPLVDFIRALPRDAVFSVEIPMLAEALAGHDPQDRMSRVVAATAALFDAARGKQ